MGRYIYNSPQVKFPVRIPNFTLKFQINFFLIRNYIKLHLITFYNDFSMCNRQIYNFLFFLNFRISYFYLNLTRKDTKYSFNFLNNFAEFQLKVECTRK